VCIPGDIVPRHNVARQSAGVTQGKRASQSPVSRLASYVTQHLQVIQPMVRPFAVGVPTNNSNLAGVKIPNSSRQRGDIKRSVGLQAGDKQASLRRANVRHDDGPDSRPNIAVDCEDGRGVDWVLQRRMESFDQPERRSKLILM
jgi:hypothetical protein